jgi:hypothetical protein
MLRQVGGWLQAERKAQVRGGNFRANLRKATVCLSVRKERLGSQWTDFHEILYLGTFLVPFENVYVSLQSHRTTGTLYENLGTFMVI